MEQKKFTLTDLVIGIKNAGLFETLDAAPFQFLIGLLLVASELDFKNPISLNNEQAICHGAGKYRQEVHRRAGALKKLRIDGKRVVRVKPGSHSKNTSAEYEIDYNLILSYNQSWCESNGHASQIRDGRYDASYDGRYDSRYDHPKNYIYNSLEEDLDLGSSQIRDGRYDGCQNDTPDETSESQPTYAWMNDRQWDWVLQQLGWEIESIYDYVNWADTEHRAVLQRCLIRHGKEQTLEKIREAKEQKLKHNTIQLLKEWSDDNRKEA